MTRTNSYDVAIIGSGPAGSVTASRILELSDLSVGLFEKDNFAGESNVCAGGISKQTIDMLKIPERVIDKQIHRCLIFSDGTCHEANDVSFGSVRREVFDRYLAEDAEKKGAELHTKMRINDIERYANKWLLNHREFEASVVVFADGVRSGLRGKYGLGFVPSVDNTWLGLVYDVVCDDIPENMDFFYGDRVSHLGYGWQFPKTCYMNVGAVLHRSFVKECNIKESLKYIMNEYITKRFGEVNIEKKSAALMPCEMADQIFNEDGLLVVGDAAGFVRPFDGGGLESGIQSGMIAARAAVGYLNNDHPISRYEVNIKKTEWYLKFKIEMYLMKLFKRYPMYYHLFFKSRVLPHLI